MLFEYRYFGSSAVQSSSAHSGMSFAPDTGRDPTFLRGTLRQKLPFRECISALHHVVVSDLRFKAKDRTEYLAWRRQQDELDWTSLVSMRKENQAQLAAAQAELLTLRNKQAGRQGPFLKAKRAFFDWLYKKNIDAWIVLDPVITVHPDEVAFECFSQDESSYGRLSCSHEVFEQLGERSYGTTNVDYSYTLYDEMQKIREYKTTSLTVDPAGFETQTGTDEAYREVKIDLPDSWVRGFLQVSTAMTLPGAARLTLHPMDIHNLCFALRRRKEAGGPRSLRFLLEPGQPIQVLVEPWGLKLDFPRSPYTGATKQEIRVWGRRRLLTLERLIPVARSFEVVLLGTGMPSFWMADCGDLTFTLGLSGWTSNDWASAANFDLLAPRGEVDSHTLAEVWRALSERWLASTAELVQATRLSAGTVESALVELAQVGRVMYDLRRGVWRKRELARSALDLSTLRYSNPREEEAIRLVQAKGVLVSSAENANGVALTGRVGKEQPTCVIDADRRLREATCTCSFYFQNKLKLGPCAHILAIRLAHDRRLGDIQVTAPKLTKKEVAHREGDGAGFVRFLRELGMLEVQAQNLAPLGVEADRIFRLERTPAGKANQLLQLFNRSPLVDEHNFEDDDSVRAQLTRWTE